MKRTRLNLVSEDGGREPPAKECRQPLDIGRDENARILP